MAKQSFVWTCLPNGLTGDSRGLRVSVLLSPRLDAESDRPVLATFREWLDWPATLRSATITLFADGQRVARHRVEDDAAADASDSEVWRALFRKDVRVESYRLNTEVLQSEILSHSTTDIHDLVRDLYRDLAARAGEALPRIGADLLANPGWSALVTAVERVDRWGSTEREQLRSSGPGLPIGRGETQIERRFGGLRQLADGSRAGTAAGNPDATARHLARFELFHTPPLRPKPLTPAPRDDKRIEVESQEFERPPMPDKNDLATSLDFHRIVAAMNAYPVLQRRLGLVVDLVVSRQSLPRKADVLLRAEVEFRAPALTTPRKPDVTPITHVAHTGDGFFAASRPHLDPHTATRVHQGLLDLYRTPERYAVLQADVDGAGLKLMNFARTLGGYKRAVGADPAALADEVSRKDKVVGAPALRTGGMMLVQKDRALSLQQRFDANQKQANDAAAGVAQLWAEDLTRGYRIDVWDGQVGSWRSLCRRTAEYLLDGGLLLVKPETGEEEATVQLAATRSPDRSYNPEILYLHEAIVSWLGWSLAAPPPGRSIADDQKAGRGGKPDLSDEAEMPPGLDFRSRFKPVRGSLPRLRYGRRYDLRARAVDLAGNSLPLHDKDFGPERPELAAKPFLRFEPLMPPVVALVRPAGGATETPGEGESMCRLAIRSFNDAFNNATPTDQIARRYAVPPQSTVRDAELHGMLDADGVLDATTFQMLANEKDRDARDAAAALVEEQIARQGMPDPAAVATTFAVWREGRKMTYLPDPLAHSVTACFIGHRTMPQDESVSISLYDAGGRWPGARPFLIELYEDSAAKPAFDAGRHALRIPLEKGERATLRLSMRLSKNDLMERMGLWQWLDPATQHRLERDALEGRHWMFTPWQDIELVHAVQRPLIRPEIETLSAERESPGATSATPHFEAVCSLKSTDRIDVLAHWHEPEDNAQQPAPGDRPRDALAFQIRITEERDYTHAHDALPDHAPPDPAHPDRIEINSRWLDLVAKKRHEFNDTRYRRIEYRLKATTRYREYLPPELRVETDPRTGEHRPIDTHLAVEGAPAVTWIPSSAPPPAPQVLYLVPTFGWTRARADDGTARSWRRGGGLRVYLDRPWHVTGYGEMLAVVLPPAGFAEDPDKFPAGTPYKKYVTQWGNDPIRESPFVAGLAPARGAFPLARWQPDPKGTWLPPGAPATEGDQQPGTFKVTLSPPGRDASGVVEIAPHDVFYDQDRQLWYCDIEIDQGHSYWPFVRLALARYQPVSTAGAHLSDVVLADFMQLTTDRWLTVRPEREGRVRHVTVYGFGYSDSAGAREARDERPRSERDWQSGDVAIIAPAPISPHPVVEVFLEELDPALGEDFGWHRIAAGEPARSSPLPASSPSVPRPLDTHALSPEQVVGATRMLGSRQFEAVLRDGLAEKIALAPALWDGTVTLPEARERTARFRVAVAEYEEYPIDGETGPADGFDPSSTTRTRTGRRLVFVEHVALAVDIATVSIPKELETMPFLISITGATQGVFKGESLRPDQAGKTVGLGFSYELTSGPAAGTRVHGPVSIIKAVGASSPQIFEALVTHETLTSVLLEFLKTDSLGADVVVYTVKLTDVVVSEIRQKLDPSSQPGQPLDNLEYESVSFVFQQIDVTSLVGNTTATDTLGP